MKFFAAIMCFFIIAVTTLPSVRAIKKTFSEKCYSNSSNKTTNDAPSGCEKEKIISNLSFYPLQIVSENQIVFSATIRFLETFEKQKSNYKKIFIDQFQIKIWQPPKIISFV